MELTGTEKHRKTILLQEATREEIVKIKSDKINMCDTISITKATQYKFEWQITNHTKVESIINLRTLTVQTLTEPGSKAPRSPINLVTM